MLQIDARLTIIELTNEGSGRTEDFPTTEKEQLEISAQLLKNLSTLEIFVDDTNRVFTASISHLRKAPQ